MKRMACVLAFAAGTGIVLGIGVQPVLADPVPARISSGLKLNIVPPGTVTNDGPIKLDVNFRGGAIRSIELLVDGARVFKKAVKLSDSNGAFNFSIPGDLLPAGDHEVVVVAYDSDGNTATSSVRMHVSSSQVDGIAHFVYPKRDAKVQDVVPVEIKLDPGINNPYVAFLLDNDFMAMRNYGPYIYNWDSKKVADGPHIISVEIYDADTHLLQKKLTIPVNVLNGGRFTKIPKNQDAPAVIKNQSAPTSAVNRIIGTAISPPNSQIVDAGTALSRAARPFHSFTLRGQEPGTNQFVDAIAATPPLSIVPTIDPNAPNTLSASEGITSHEPKNSGTRSVTPRPFLNSITDLTGASEPAFNLGAFAENGKLARVKLSARRSGNIAARPRAELDSAPVVDALPPAPAQPLTVRPVSMPLTIRPVPSAHPRTTRAISSTTFDVAFDNSRIAFDVPPRVEHGLPLAPFRAIFEHSGGSVQWYDKSQTVRAVNSNREIEFKIGERSARVNNQKVNMAAKPYLDRGRAIVPLSFVKDAMNVKVTYDAKSGHLLIESKK